MKNYGRTFNWGVILSSAITRALERTKENNIELAPSFFMLAYLLDCMCASFEFISMNWETNNNLPISEVFQHLQFNKYKSSYSIIWDFFWAPLFKFFYGKECPSLFEDAKMVIKYIGDWFLVEEYTYIRIYGITTPPYILPKYVLDNLLLSQIAFQTIIVHFNSFLSKG